MEPDRPAPKPTHSSPGNHRLTKALFEQIPFLENESPGDAKENDAGWCSRSHFQFLK